MEEDYKRICSVCGAEMSQGFVVDEGLEYFCSEKCLHKEYSEEEYQEMYDNDIAYWTEWEE